MARLQAFPQTEREAQQIHTIAFLILLLGERSTDEAGNDVASVFIPREHVNVFAGKGVALYLDEGEEGDTLTANVYDPVPIVVKVESEE